MHSAGVARLLAAPLLLNSLDIDCSLGRARDAIITSISSMTALQHLSLGPNSIIGTLRPTRDAVNAAPLAALHRLQSLALRYMKPLQGLEQVSEHCTALRTLALTKLRIEPPTARCQHPWPALQEVTLSDFKAAAVASQLSAAGVLLPPAAPALKALKLQNIAARNMRELHAMAADLAAAVPQSLAGLELGVDLDCDYRSVPPAALVALPGISGKLTALSISWDSGGEADFEWGAVAGPLPHIPHLQHLTIGSQGAATKLNDSLACLIFVREHTGLRTLSLKRVILPELAVLCAAQFAQADAQRTSPLTMRLCDKPPTPAAVAAKAAWEQIAARLPGPPRVIIELCGLD